MDHELRKKIKKARGELNKLSQLKQCFSFNKDCNKNIIHAHSIQENGRLSLIEGDVNGNKVLYNLTEIVAPDENSPLNLSLTTGKAKASSFTGFCQTHDQLLFSKIEGINPYDKSSEHNFLHSYRSYAYNFHTSVAGWLGLLKSEGRNGLDLFVEQRGIQGLEVLMAEVENHVQVRNRLNTILENKAFDDLNYFVYTKKGKYLVAASICVMPNFTVSGQKMFDSPLEAIPMMVTALPDKEESFVILATFKEHEMGNIFIEELKKFSPVKIEEVISSLLIQNFDNTFISPALWNALGLIGRKQLIEDIANFKRTYAFSRKSIKGFIINRVNFYNKTFSGEYLGV